MVLASGNRGKLRELEQLLAPTGMRVHPQARFAVPAVEETGATFVENALLKARAATAAAGLPAIADDSGLMVDALHGAPGVRSARYAGDAASDADNVARLLEALAGTAQSERGACFVCVVVCLLHPDDPAPVIAEGRWRGRILDAPRGAGGFGYDPVFLVPEVGRTAAELPAARKNRLSHRGRALRTMLATLAGPGADGVPRAGRDEG